MRPDDDFSRLIHEAYAQEGRKLREAHPEEQRTPECPPTPMFLARHRNGDWTQRDKKHFATGCRFCARHLRIAARLEQPPRFVFLLVHGRNLVAAGRRGDPTAVTAVPAGEQRWHLEPAAEHRIDTDDGPAFRLPDAIVARCYDVPEGIAVDCRIDLLLDPAGETFVPSIEVSPAPHKGKEPVRLVLRFADDCEREFVVAVKEDALIARPVKLRSAPAEALPAAVVAAWRTSGAPTPLSADFRGGDAVRSSAHMRVLA